MENRPRTEPGQITLQVGQQEGDLRGDDDRVLQAAVDYVSGLGGGRVCVLDGVYTLNNSLFLKRGVCLSGSGPGTILKKCGGVRHQLVRDADWYEACVEVADAGSFRPGCGIMLRAYAEKGDGLRSVVRETVTRVDQNVIALSGRLGSDMWLQDRASATALFPLITAREGTHDIQVKDITLDGNFSENEEINGNYSGGVFIQRCDRWSFHRVTSRNYNGDGFSFQVCDDIHLTECRSEDNANLGFHPGSGSQRPVFKECVSARNSQGIFFCWGVSDGLVDGCVCSYNRDYGISIGHRDTDNRILNTEIAGNRKVGVLFREQEAFRAGHRNVISGCKISDNGVDLDGVGVDVRGQTSDVEIRENVISDTGQGVQKIGVQLGAQTTRIETGHNTFIGLSEDVSSLSKQKETAS